ncbi:hypothetical protein [Dyadobacter sp. NIV53]|uniref:hypothetical protein n=1 Tax=Dyadobacter sp. NIV53 TaxID=2861765 RepID=UPI001C84F3E9|nr:hypothetical protein [Dyadobacter sp. NIV53]
MKNWFTCLVAIALLSLCILEKQAKENALLIQNENFARSDEPVQKESKNQNILVKSEFLDDNNIFASDKTNAIDTRLVIAKDSISFL